MRQLVLLFGLLVLCSCSKEDLLSKFSSPEDQATAKAYLNHLRAREFDVIERDIDPSLKNASLHSVLEQIADQIPTGEPTSVKLVGAHLFKTPEATTVDTALEYSFGDKWFLANVGVQKKGDVKTIVGLHFVPEPRSLEEQNRFVLSGKPLAQYLILVGAVLVVSTTLFSLIVCIRTKELRRKWLWILFIIFGFGSISVNWTTGQFGFVPLSFQFFSAGAMAQLYGPWIISVSAPVGAIVFLVNRLRRSRAEKNDLQAFS